MTVTDTWYGRAFHHVPTVTHLVIETDESLDYLESDVAKVVLFRGATPCNRAEPEQNETGRGSLALRVLQTFVSRRSLSNGLPTRHPLSNNLPERHPSSSSFLSPSPAATRTRPTACVVTLSPSARTRATRRTLRCCASPTSSSRPTQPATSTRWSLRSRSTRPTSGSS